VRRNVRGQVGRAPEHPAALSGAPAPGHGQTGALAIAVRRIVRGLGRHARAGLLALSRAFAHPHSRAGALAAAMRRAFSGRRLGRPTGREAMTALAAAVGLRGWRSGVAVATSALALLVLLGVGLGGHRGARLMPGRGALPEVIGFYQNGWSAIYKSSFPSVQQHYQTIDTVLAFWYSVDGDGQIHSHAPKPGVAAWIKAHHMRMGVLINNIAGPSGDNGGMLTNARSRAGAVQAIDTLVRQHNYQAVNIDFELLKPNTRQGLVAFMQALRAALPKDVVLSESVFPKLGVPQQFNGAYDYAALAQSADYLVIMLYDKHSDGGPAGPVSPYSWVSDNMQWFLHTAHIPPQHLALAAGVYGYDWVVGGTTATEMPLTQVTSRQKAVGATKHVDGASENPYYHYTDANGRRHVVWYQDQDTVLQRLRLAQKLGLRGVAIWALGEETPGVWGVIDQTWGAK